MAEAPFTPKQVAESLRESAEVAPIDNVVALIGGDCAPLTEVLRLAAEMLDPPSWDPSQPNVLPFAYDGVAHGCMGPGSGLPLSQEQKIEFRKEWDRRVDEGKILSEGA